jgi:hypothetical protein
MGQNRFFTFFKQHYKKSNKNARCLSFVCELAYCLAEFFVLNTAVMLNFSTFTPKGFVGGLAGLQSN